jgi:DNA repair exonuclease SbcCD ATPase subunit
MNQETIEKLKKMKPFIEDDFPNGIDDPQHCATDEYRDACRSYLEVLAALQAPACATCGSCSHFMYCTHERKVTHNKNGECSDYVQAPAPAGEKQLILCHPRQMGKMIEWVKQLRPEVKIEESDCQKKLKILTQAREQQGKRIEELEAENAGLESGIHRAEEMLNDYRKEINQLEAANAEKKKEIEKLKEALRKIASPFNKLKPDKVIAEQALRKGDG